VKPPFDRHRTHIDRLRDAAIRAVDPAAAVRRSLAPSDLECKGRIFVVGAGKAGAAMFQAVESILGDRIASGAVSVPQLPAAGSDRVRFILGGHPLPDEGSLSAGGEIARMLENASQDDLVLVLLSGGGSALMELPQPGVSLEDIRTTTDLLLKSGASIREVNCLRTPQSRIKGGGLARMASPARVLSLILSDVVGNSLETIASGPTFPRKYSPEEIHAVLEKYHLRESLPTAVMEALKAYAVDSSVSGEQIPAVENRIIASNRTAGEAAADEAHRLGFHLACLADDWQGEAREAGRRFAELLVRESGKGPACCIAGGETTVTVRGGGKGGRNQEAALAAAIALDGKAGVAVASFATDGVDGPTDAAGAIVTGQTIERARSLGMDPLRFLNDNNSYPFFSALGDLILTGPTGTNVNDLWIGLVYR
jgi:glycerate 2-kinase